MAPYKALYRRPCRSPLCWIELGESHLLGPEIVQDTTEKIHIIKEKLKTIQDRQKSYADQRRMPLKFEGRGLGACKSVPSKRHILIWKKWEVSP